MRGTIVTGKGVAAGLVAHIEEQLVSTLGFHPYPGTMNLRGVPSVEALPEHRVGDVDIALDNCDGIGLRPCSVGGVRAALVRPIAPGYPEWKSELVAPVHLRTLFGLADGDAVQLAPPDELWGDGPEAAPTELDSFDAVVFDLDGTLVRLAVDWPTVRAEIRALFGPGMDPLAARRDRDDHDTLYDLAREHGVYDELLEVLAAHESAGADAGTPLPLLDCLTELDCPVGVCTKNALSAAERALDRFGVSVDAIVARETVPEDKPHPRPLLVCLDALGVCPGDAAFVGDDPTDAETAARAGSSFLRADRLVG